MVVSVFSNGSTIDRDVADRLACEAPFLIEVTLYGASEATYERVTGSAAGYSLARRAVELLLQRHLHVGLKAMLLQTTAGDIAALRRYAAQCGTRLKLDHNIKPRNNGDPGPMELTVPLDVIGDVGYEQDPALPQWRRQIQRREAGIAEGEPVDTVYTCGAGRTTFVVDAYGGMRMCVLSPSPLADLTRDSFAEGWRRLQAERARKASPENPCVQCRLRSWCGYCPVVGDLLFGDPERPPGWYGRLAAARAERLGVPVSAAPCTERETDIAAGVLGDTHVKGGGRPAEKGR
jgi:radical SAM protein with 4Fe4S-binding SPASM domain